MSKNIGWSKRLAKEYAKDHSNSWTEAYVQREDYFYHGFLRPRSSHQWIVVLQKRHTKKGTQ